MTDVALAPPDVNTTADTAPPAPVGNPATIGVPTFIVGSVALGMVLIGFVPATAVGASIPIILAATGIGQLVAAVWALSLAQNAVAAVFGIDDFMPMPRVDEVTDLDDEARSYPIITGDYSATPKWQSRDVILGTPIAKPTPIFAKLDPSVIEEENARLAGTCA